MGTTEEWIGVDFDRTLATFPGGVPIASMVERVKAWLATGTRIRIFTARVAGEMTGGGSHDYQQAQDERVYIQRWCVEHVGQALPVTCVKDMDMIELWDDRAVGVVPNTGERADGKL